jgi:hypothetical protein
VLDFIPGTGGAEELKKGRLFVNEVVISKFKSGPESTGVKQTHCFKVNRLVMLINLVYLVKSRIVSPVLVKRFCYGDLVIIIGCALM